MNNRKPKKPHAAVRIPSASVVCSSSSNRTGPIKAYGSPTALTKKHSALPLRTMVGRSARELVEPQLIEKRGRPLSMRLRPFTVVLTTHPQTELAQAVAVYLAESRGAALVLTK